MENTGTPLKLAIQKIHEIIDKWISSFTTFTGYLMAAFMTILFIQVVMRFVFKNPIYGADEMVTALMIWSMAIGNAIVYWNNEHAVIEFCMKKAHKLFKILMHHVTNFLVLITSLVYIPGGVNLFKMQNKLIPLGGLPFTKAYYYALPIIVMGVMLVVLSAFKTVEYIVTKDEKLLMPVQGEGGISLD